MTTEPSIAGSTLPAIIERALLGRTTLTAARGAAQAVLDAGYRPPRITIDSLNALSELPEDSVIRTHDLVFEKQVLGWHAPRSTAIFTPGRHWLPATVLYDPREDLS